MFSPFRLRITPYHDSTSEPGSCVCASQQNGRPTTSMGQKYALPHCKSKNRLSRRKLITKHTLLSNDAASRNTASRTTVSGICPSKPHADANRCRTEHQVQSPGQLAIRSAYALMAIPAARAYRWHPSENGLDCANGIQGPEPKGRYEIVRVLKVQPLTGEHVSDPPSIRS
jgi:hypothetical protein